MRSQHLLTVIANDRTGIVESIAACIHAQGGNWLESRLSRLSGKFAGIIQIEITSDKVSELTQALKSLEGDGFKISIEAIDAASNSETNRSNNQTPVSNTHSTSYSFTIAGNDRSGIIKEVSQAFAVRKINLENLQSQCTSAPHVGTPLFEASGKISVPSSTDIDELSKHLDRISDELAIDIQLEAI